MYCRRCGGRVNGVGAAVGAQAAAQRMRAGEGGNCRQQAWQRAAAQPPSQRQTAMNSCPFQMLGGNGLEALALVLKCYVEREGCLSLVLRWYANGNKVWKVRR